MFIVFPFVILASFWGRYAGGNAIFKALHFWSDIWFLMCGLRVSITYEVPHNLNKQYVFVANHISYLDAAMLVKIFRQPFRPLGKIELQSIPIFGYIYKQVVVLVNRSDAEHRRQSIQHLLNVMKHGISIIIFPEGTFNETTEPLGPFFDGAFRIAIETQTPIKPVIFPDTFTRMHPSSILTLTPGPCRAIFLAEIPVAGYTLNELPELKQQVMDVMSAKLREYKAPWIGGNTQ
ncbi:MAG: lysophospholipid acyltransferase family protein [Sphingobacteriales bacterium]|jgi:1-acyl-sn-glycerol-3-phosphate acyltransferase